MSGSRRTIGERIRYFREQQGLSKSALAKRIGVTVARVWEWESGKHVPDAASVSAIALALKVLPLSLTSDALAHQWIAPEYVENPKPLKLGSLTVNNVFVIVGDGREALDIRVKYSAERFTLHRKIESHYFRLSALVRQRALERGAAFWDGPIVRLLRINESGSHQHVSGYEKRVVELELGPVSWTQFSVLNTMLDEPNFFDTNPSLTLREALVDPDLLYRFPMDCGACPLSNMLTICMMPVTRDGFSVIQQRSMSNSAEPGKLISGYSENTHRWLDEAPSNDLWRRIHPLVSVSSLAGTVDVNYQPAAENVPSLYLTAQRGFYEELAELRLIIDAGPAHIKFTGIVWDMNLYQPALVGVVDLPLTVNELMAVIHEHRGRDHSEYTDLIVTKLSRHDEQTQRLASEMARWDLGGLAAFILAISYAERKAERNCN